MQGRSTIGSFTETVDIDMSQSTSFSNIPNPVLSRLSNYVPSGEQSFMNGVSHDIQSFNGWNSDIPSSSSSQQNQESNDGMKIENEPSSSFIIQQCGASSVSEEGQYETTNRSSGEDTGTNLFMQRASKSEVTGQTSSCRSPTDDIGTSSGISRYMPQEAIGGSSCKRKALEGTSSQSHPIGSQTSFPQAEIDASGSLSLSTLSESSQTSLPDQLNPSIGVANARTIFPNVVPSYRTAFSGRHVESPFHLTSPMAVSARRSNSPHRSSRPVSFTDPPDLRSTAMTAAQTPSPTLQISGSSRNLHPYLWNRLSNHRSGNLSSSFFRGERGSAAREEPDLRNVHRPIGERGSAVQEEPDLRNMFTAQELASWGMASSSTQIGSSSSIPPLPSSNLTQNQQRLPEYSPWSYFPSGESDLGSHAANFSPSSSGHYGSSQDAVISSGTGSQGRHSRRSVVTMDRQGDDVLGMTHSWRALHADIEGRHQLISEIRQVLSAMRRGENVPVEDYMLLDPFLYHGMAEIHDRHRDMRLDVDNMSYEELLALGERIGDVSTGLGEDIILKLLKQQRFTSTSTDPPFDLEPCCVCQEEYVDGDDLGNLGCGHEFHTKCIKEWLTQKNICPICKTTALDPSEKGHHS